MTGLEIDARGFGFHGFDLPRWQSPDVGFSWKRQGGRPSRDLLWRDIAILCFIEQKRRQGTRPRRAAREACERFSERPGDALALATVEKYLKRLGWDLDDWLPLSDTDESLERQISFGLDEIAARRAEKKTASD